MKINYLYGSIAIRQRDGYTENLEFNVTDTKGLTFRYPYGEATPEEAEAISQFVKTVTNAYNKLTAQIDNVNRDLKLEQYAPIESAPDTEPESAVAPTDEPPVGTTQTESIGAECEIMDAPFEEVETRTNNPVDAILATESSPEDGEAVAFFAEGLSKIIDARKKKD